MKPRILLLLLAVAIAAVLTGCGGSDGSEDTLTKAAFIKQADKICERRGEEMYARLSTYVKEQPNEGAGMSQDELFAGAMRDILLPSVEAKIAEVESLGGPSRDGQEVEAYLAAMEDGLADVKEGESTEYVELNDSLVELEERFNRAERIGREFGMKICPW